MKIIECVPNFSEGRNLKTIADIAAAVAGVEGVRLLHTDVGRAANRTVFTFAGEPSAVCEAAFRAVGVACQRIDMRDHSGEHPRIGATDVLPLVPVSGVSLEECAELARGLAQRVSECYGVPVYCYEAAAQNQSRAKLEDIRKGEYEGLRHKITQAGWEPDFGVAEFTEQTERSGAVVLGARNFLIAVNFNLNTTDHIVAAKIAGIVRESGRVLVGGGRQKGLLRNCKAIGWYIQEYGCAQVSVNITDISTTPLHTVFEVVSKTALECGALVTGTEIIGLVPLSVMVDAGRHFMQGVQGVEHTDAELVSAAIQTMNLSEVAEFIPTDKILEYKLNYN